MLVGWLRIAAVVWFAVGAVAWAIANLPGEPVTCLAGFRGTCDLRVRSVAEGFSMMTTAVPWLAGTLALRLLAIRMARRQRLGNP